MDRAGAPMISDIGIHKLLEDTRMMHYGSEDDVRRLAPEVLLGQDFTASSDTYSFGCLALGEFLLFASLEQAQFRRNGRCP